ncbi:MAG: hypothetical protein ACREPM_15785, partial [Gemmatimonadaceae bacterium]
LLAGTPADVISASDVEGIAAAIKRRAAAYVFQGARPTRIATDERFSRATQARILFDAIEGLTPSK